MKKIVLLVLVVVGGVLLINPKEEKETKGYTPVPTPTVHYSPTPTPTKKPVYVKPKPTVDPDPPVHCRVSDNCGGGTIPLKQSECSKSVCCQVNGNWIQYRDRDQCNRDQRSGSRSSSYSYPTYNYTFPTVAPLPTLEPFPTIAPRPISQEEIDARIADCKADIRRATSEKISACYSQFGGGPGSIGEFCAKQAEESGLREIANCY